MLDGIYDDKPEDESYYAADPIPFGQFNDTTPFSEPAQQKPGLPFRVSSYDEEDARDASSDCSPYEESYSDEGELPLDGTSPVDFLSELLRMTDSGRDSLQSTMKSLIISREKFKDQNLFLQSRVSQLEEDLADMREQCESLVRINNKLQQLGADPDAPAITVQINELKELLEREHTRYQALNEVAKQLQIKLTQMEEPAGMINQLTDQNNQLKNRIEELERTLEASGSLTKRGRKRAKRGYEMKDFNLEEKNKEALELIKSALEKIKTWGMTETGSGENSDIQEESDGFAEIASEEVSGEGMYETVQDKAETDYINMREEVSEIPGTVIESGDEVSDSTAIITDEVTVQDDSASAECDGEQESPENNSRSDFAPLNKRLQQLRDILSENKNNEGLSINK